MELIEAASAEFERVVRELPAGSWNQPTPSEVSVGELGEHVVVGNRLTALLLAGVGRDEARAMLGGDQLGMIPSPRWSIRRDSRQGRSPVHAWDLLRAARLDKTLDPAVVAGLLSLVERHLNDVLAFGAYGEGPSGAVPLQAPPQTRLLDRFGRRP